MNRQEMQKAIEALSLAGFSKQRAYDLLSRRGELRDDFALSAMHSLLSRTPLPIDDAARNRIADEAYAMSEAMLRARRQRDPSDRRA